MKKNISQKKDRKEELSERDVKQLMKKQSIYTRGPGGAFRQKQIMKI